jgi:glycosyltransferase involved in cell wall biosynthesis
MSGKPRVLVIAEAANPEWVSVPLVGWSLANALREVAEVHIVTQIRNREAILRKGLREGPDFTAIDSESVARPLYLLSRFLRGGSATGWTTGTAIQAFSYYSFEHKLWNQFRDRIKGGEFDLVHRVTPLSPTAQSLIAKKCYRCGVPFLLGPLNGGVAWPSQFRDARIAEREWLSYVRSAYRLLPGARAQLKYSSAVLAGSLATKSQISRENDDKVVYLPENAVDLQKFSGSGVSLSNGPLRIAFVGRLVPYKGADMLLQAAASLIRAGKIQVDILGSGPMQGPLEELVQNESLSGGVTLHGWVQHENLHEILTKSQVFGFPSIREFGGGAVLEAMALGLVPIVVDYAGPAELVTPEVGFKVPLGTRGQIIDGLRKLLEELVENPGLLPGRSAASRERVRRLFTWKAKADQIRQVYDWVLGVRATKPDFGFLE